MNVKFSLIMPAYNAEKYITDAINSVLNQSYQNWELIIVDDGSTDGTAKILDNYTINENKIVVIHQNNSGTAAAARNVALEYVTGDYVQMIDSDDIISDDLLMSYNIVLQDRKLDIIVPNCLCFNNDDISNVFWEKKTPLNDYSNDITGSEAFKLSLDWSINGVFLVRSSIIKRIKYDPVLINGDEFTTRKVLYSSKKVGFVNSYYYYRRNLVSTTRNSKNKYRMFESIITDMNIYEYSLANHMDNSTVDICIYNLARSLCGYCLMFCRDKDHTHLDDKNSAKVILEKIYNKINCDMWKRVPWKYRIFYIFSRGKFEMFIKGIKYVSIFRRGGLYQCK